jgi:hypothetical protein
VPGVVAVEEGKSKKDKRKTQLISDKLRFIR